MHEEILSNYKQTIEQALGQLKVDPQGALLPETAYIWKLQRGSASVYVNLFYSEKNNMPYLSVVSPLVPLPQDVRADFYEELLQLNERMFGVGYAINAGYVVLRASRECRGMDEIEAYNIINRIGYYADSHDNMLAEKYHLELGGQPKMEDIHFF